MEPQGVSSEKRPGQMYELLERKFTVCNFQLTICVVLCLVAVRRFPSPSWSIQSHLRSDHVTRNALAARRQCSSTLSLRSMLFRIAWSLSNRVHAVNIENRPRVRWSLTRIENNGEKKTIILKIGRSCLERRSFTRGSN